MQVHTMNFSPASNLLVDLDLVRLIKILYQVSTFGHYCSLVNYTHCSRLHAVSIFFCEEYELINFC